MNILIISPFLPYPLDQGGKIRIFNLIKHLSKNHSVTLAAIVDDVRGADAAPLQELCAEVLLAERPARLWGDRLSFFSGTAPYNVIRYRSHDLRRALLELKERRSFDVVQIEFTMMWQYARLFRDIPVVLDAHNIEYKNVSQIGSTKKSLLWSMMYRIEERRLRAVEEQAWTECALCFAVSEGERVEIAAFAGDNARVIGAANGVDPERFPFRPRVEGGKRILFLGGMDYTPNLDAARHFIGEIFPLIRREESGATLLLVGRELGRLGEVAEQPGIELHESVPDVLPWFYRADLLAVPLRHGAGTRIKVLEAFSAGLPVVATSKGCEGIGAVNGKELVVADSAEAFASAAVELLRDPHRGRELARKARELVLARYTWQRAAQAIEEAYGRMLRR